jgi:lipoprotein-anchoring transpeptidase ErfK/SrfK
MMSGNTRAHSWALGCLLFGAGACHQGPPEGPDSLATSAVSVFEQFEPPVEGPERRVQDPVGVAQALVGDADAEIGEGELPATPPQVSEPIATLRAKRAHTVFASPSRNSKLRGRVSQGSDFHIFARQEGPGCRAEWLQVQTGGWLCGVHTEPGKGDPIARPQRLEGSDVPFIYARHRHHRAPETQPLEVFRTLHQLNKGAEPISTLVPYGSHAFARRVWNRGEPVFLTAKRRAVSAKDMIRFRPSAFEGRELESRPIPHGQVLAWTIYAETEVFAEARPKAAVVSTLPRHSELLVTPVEGKEEWVQLVAPLSDGRPGFIPTPAIQRFVPVVPTREVNSDEVTIDVDLERQTLSLWRGREAVFVTLISSGKAGDRTPRGLFELQTKWAFGKMASREGSDERYYVDAVPWPMYFSGRYALHASYWHNRFGQRMSHGCINLSPRDARYLFEHTAPGLPDGWLLVHAWANDPGTTLRIRRGDRSIPDRRNE